MSYCKPFKQGVSWRSQNFGDNATIYGPHSGNDDAAPIGTPVHAAGDGYIEWAGEFDDTYLDNLLWLLKMGGNIAVLNCGANAPSFVYGHMDRFTVKRGDWVRKGQVIGYSGNTGTATTGAHLHTEAIPPGYALNSPMLGRVNPDRYLTEWPEDVSTGSPSYAGGPVTLLPDHTPDQQFFINLSIPLP
jgi:murein DD-endopeptidase MepM/ murein hydrolase activator NlpD